MEKRDGRGKERISGYALLRRWRRAHQFRLYELDERVCTHDSSVAEKEKEYRNTCARVVLSSLEGAF